MRRLNILTVWLLATLAFFLPDTVHAARGVVTIDIAPETGEVPTHLCVVSESDGPRAREQLWNYLETDPVTGPSGGQHWRVLPRAWAGSPNRPPPSCSEDPKADCRAAVELPAGMSKQSELYVACTADSLFAEAEGADDPRLLVLLLERLDASPPAIESIRLTGGIATIGVDGFSSNAVVTARSLGGHYMPHRRTYAQTQQGGGTKRIDKLPVGPRCRWSEVTLPRTSLVSADRARLEVKVHGIPLDTKQCLGALGGPAFRVLLPRAPVGVGTMEVTLSGSEGAAPARFGGSWDGAWPRTPYDLEFRQITFSWRRPACVYPENTCPAATLENGTVCAPSVTAGGCEYTCPDAGGSGSLDLPLPMGITFEKEDPRQRWTDRLAQNGQELSSFVDAKDIFLNVDLAGWRTEAPGNEIKRIRFFLPDGSAAGFNVTKSQSLQVNVPNASCAPVPYEVDGDRRYDERRARVEGGRLITSLPQDHAKVVGFNVLLAAGGGPAWSPIGQADAPPVFFNGMLQFALNFRPRKPRFSRLAVEARVAAMLGQWGAVRFDDPSDPNGKTFNDFIWVRFFAGPGLVADLSRRIAMGVGVDFGTSFPARSDQDLTGGNFQFIVSPNLDVRVKVRNWLSLILQFRGVVDKAFEQAGDTTMTNEDRSATAGTLLTLFGLLASF